MSGLDLSREMAVGALLATGLTFGYLVARRVRDSGILDRKNSAPSSDEEIKLPAQVQRGESPIVRDGAGDSPVDAGSGAGAGVSLEPLIDGSDPSLFTDPDDPSNEAIPGLALVFAAPVDQPPNFHPLARRKVAQLISKCGLCFLSTGKVTQIPFGGEKFSEPHLSLMKFTYDRYANVVIMTTRRNTQKFRNLLNNSRAAVMLHDYPDKMPVGADVTQTLAQGAALTLYGRARLPRTQEADELFREVHLNNPHCEGYFHFILPKEEFAVVLLEVHFAKMVEINNRVISHEFVRAGADGSSETAAETGASSSRTPEGA